MKNKVFKYLAIGDSISQGFNSKVGCGTAGYKNSQEFIKGYSYADYFMEFYLDYVVKTYPNNWKEHWDNIEMENISSSTLRISDLNSLISGELNLSVLNVIDINNELARRANLKLNQDFWKLDPNLTDEINFQNLSFSFIGKLKEADFLTISIGGNEFQSSYPFIKFRNLVLEKDFYKQKVIKKEIFDFLEKVTFKTQLDLDIFIKSVKNINPNLKIFLVTYTPPFLHYYLSYEKFLRSKNPEIYNDFFKSNLGIFERIFKNVSEKNNCILVKSFDYKQWFKKSRIFAENIIDVHPTELGYQEIAKKIFISFLKNKCLYDTYDKKYFKKLSKFNVLYNKKITERNRQNINKNLFDFKDKANRIVNILAVWCNQKNDVQNPYFSLLKRNIKESRNATIVQREQYASLYTILSEQMIFILDYFDKKSKRYSFFKDKFITNENILRFLVSILESKSVLKFIELAEKENVKHPRIGITKYIENVLNNNRNAIYQIFIEIINTKNYFLNLLNDLFDSTISDWKNGYFWLGLNESVQKVLKISLSDENVTKKIYKIFRSFLVQMKENKDNFNVSKLWKKFFANEFDSLISIIESCLYNIYYAYKEKKEDAVKLIIELLNIKSMNLKYSNWKTLEKIVDKVLKNITKRGFVKFLAKLFIQTILNLNTKINLKTSYKKVFWMRIAKSFMRQIIKHPFNKNAYILITILSQLAKIKIRSALKIFDK